MDNLKFVVGDRVVGLFGHGNAGEVTTGFYQAGTKPKHGDVPVQWDDGSRSYVDPSTLAYEEI